VCIACELGTDLKEARENGDLERLTKVLRTCCSNKDIGGILNENIYSQTRVGTKFLVPHTTNARTRTRTALLALL
jgi:hypothetical protein